MTPTRPDHLPARRPRTAAARPVTTAPTRVGSPDATPLASLVASARRIKGRTVARSAPQAWQRVVSPAGSWTLPVYA